MNQNNFTISGRVIDGQTKQGIQSLRIEAWDKDLIFNDLVGSAKTDRQGRFSMSFTTNYFSEIFFDRRPDLFFKVFQGEKEIRPIKSPFILNMQPGEREITIEVDLSSVEEPKEFVVKGTVKDETGSPQRGLFVRAVDIDLRHEESLGETTTDTNGYYEITYTPEQFARAEKKSADLVVRVFDAQGEMLAHSSIKYNANPTEVIDLVLGSGVIHKPSEYEQLVSELTPLLDGIGFAELEESNEHHDISFLSGETGLNAQRIDGLATAHRFENYARDKIGETTGDSFALTAPVFYGLFREGMPTEIHALLSQSQELIQRALQEAISANIIPSEIEDKIGLIHDQLKSLIPIITIDQPVQVGNSTLPHLLNIVTDDPGLQQMFVDRYVSHQGTIEEFWDGLKESPDFSDKIENIQRTFQLNAITGNHLFLVKKLYAEIDSVSELAAYTEEDWLQVIHTEFDGNVIGFPSDIPGLDDDEKAHNYARAIASLTEDAFPSGFVRHRLEDDNLEGKEDLIRFLQNSPSFNIKRDSIESYFDQNPDAAAGISDIEAFKQRIKALQRVYRLSSRYKIASALLKDGIDSAHRISRMGKNYFIKKYGEPMGMVKEAVRAYECARQASAMSLHLATEYGLQNRVDMPVVPDKDVIEVPNWSTLFGPLELCECEHCKSVRGPAAYLVDLLHFLRHRPAKETGMSVRDILFARRPDLGDMNLSCENTNTPLPYVDLVNEILEDSVVPPQNFEPFELNLDIKEDLNSHKWSPDLHSAFDHCQLHTDNPEIIVGGEAEGRRPSNPWWDIDDLAFTYHIVEQDNALRVVSRSRQTRGSAEERAAIPQYINPEAYETLRDAVYPWTLPFDLDWETIKVYLAHLGTSRAEILEAFLPGERKEILHNTELMYEILNLSKGDAALISGEVGTGEPWKLWGFSDETGGSIPDPAGSTAWINVDNWLAVLTSRVDVFLQQSSLHYRQMLDLLTTQAINPPDAETGRRAIRILSKDPENQDTCDLTQLEIVGLDLQTAVLFVRFVRLWRKLGWSIYDLDRAYSAFGFDPVEADPESCQNFLAHLSIVQRLRERFNLSIESLLVFWSDIGTTAYIDHQSEGQPTLPSLYTCLFRNKNVVHLPDSAFTADPADLTGTLSEHHGTISAALGISAEEFSLLTCDSKVLSDDNLNLNNLSSLYRHTLLSRKLKLSIAGYLTLLHLSQQDPFGVDSADTRGEPLETLIFLEAVDTIRESGLSIIELDYLLRYTASSAEALRPSDDVIARVLKDIRSGLQGIASENNFTEDLSDQNGEISRQKVALLEWNQGQTVLILAILNDNIDFETALSALPNNIDFPPEDLKNKIRFDDEEQKLIFHGVMSSEETKLLKDLASDDSNYTASIDKLYETPRNELLRNLRTFSVPDCSTKELDESLVAFVADLEFPAELKDQIYYDASTRTLHFRGVMNEQEKRILSDFSRRQDYLDAIDYLYDFPLIRKVPEDDRFFYYESENIKDAYDNLDNELLFVNDTSNKPADRFSELLTRLLPYLKKRLSRSHVIQTLSADLNLEMLTCSRLLDEWLTLQDNPLLDIFRDAAFAESSAAKPITHDNFPEQFRAYLLLHKVALVISRLGLTYPQLGWLFEFPAASWPDLNDLPLEETDCTNGELDKWLQLFRLCEIRETLPNGESVLDRFFGLVKEDGDQELDSKAAIIELLNTSLGWSVENIESLIGSDSNDNGKLEIAFPGDYRDETVLWRLYSCIRLIRRVGISASNCSALCEELSQDDIANRIVQAVKAKYDDEQWLEIARPLQDKLRNMRRSALVDYLVAYPLQEKPWRDVNDLYSYLLIDPEMDACMMTSRIKQAISTVQLFVQRCLMNLEKDVAAGADVDDKWRQWRWMKNYRVWEANRRIFLYPENWIEPELRDDKSPFFKDLESELMQSDLTLETAAEAFLHYLEKLDQVARLEIVGEYHQVEKDKSGHVAKDILHVFGRTKGIPHVYFYRQRVNGFNWTAWERIDLDIEGDHLIPVVWNRRLYLFWPIFTEKIRQVESSDKPITELTTPEINPSKYWEIKLAWSERKDGKWLNKKISTQAIETDTREDKELISFSTCFDRQNHLIIKLNNRVAGSRQTLLFLLCGDLEQYIDELNKKSLSEEIRAEFESNGYPLSNRAIVVIENNEQLGAWSIHDGINRYGIYAAPNGWLDMIVYSYACDAFLFQECNQDPVIHKVLQGTSYSVKEADWKWMFLEEEDYSSGPLYLPAPDEVAALNKTPGTFFLLPHPDNTPLYRQPFFYLDDKRDFFVEPLLRSVSPDISIGNVNKIDPGQMDRWLNRYTPRYNFGIDPGAPVENPTDPTVSEPTFPDYGDMPGRGQVMKSSTKNSVATTSSVSVSGILTNVEVGGWEVVHQYDWGIANNYIPGNRFEYHYKFTNFYHPYVCNFVSYLNRDGIDGLLQRPMQLQSALLFNFNLVDPDDKLDKSILKRQFRKYYKALTDNALFSPPDVTNAEKIRIQDGGFVFTVKKDGKKVEVYKDLFEDLYQPNEEVVEQPFPYDEVDFESDGGYSLYNWELFFHAPLMIADRLSKNQRFEEAQKWFHYIFDPSDLSGEPVPQKYWRTKPFFETTGEDYRKTRIEYILRLLAGSAHTDDLSTGEQAGLDRLKKSVSQWRDDPFKPHLIARMRTTSYQKSVVMKYIDNLIAWGDRLFRRDTIESINEATQLYILAAEILGRRPENVPPRAAPGIQTYNGLLDENIGDFSNAMAEIEYFISPSASSDSCGIVNTGEDQSLPDMPYFCAPKNSKLLSYWDTVAERLFKIRHCMNIEGMVRQLPLFEPPIEPGLLVRAAAAGVDIGSALNDPSAALPYYRFQVMAQKATELCNDLKSLGASLLSALEKRDAEKLAMMRAEHESSLLKRVELIKKLQVDEAQKNIDSLWKSRETVLTRYQHYQILLGKGQQYPEIGDWIPLADRSNNIVIKKEGGQKVIPLEKQEMALEDGAYLLQQTSSGLDLTANILHLIPNLNIAPMGNGTTYGGSNVGSALSSYSNYLRMLASMLSFEAGRTGKMAQFAWRAHDWTLQNNLAARELMQIDKQILAAEIRKAMAENELDNHRKQIEETEEIEQFLKDKYTNQELYSWMSGHISGVYFQAYQLAYDVAKRAERAYRHELGINDANFIQFGYWDSLKKGLLSGEKLFQDIKQMEVSYLEKNHREYEITKHVSLLQVDPLALIQLRMTGSCELALPEEIFDLDGAGHYFRRIKNVSITIPCVTGPYMGVNCKLTLLKSSIRRSSAASDADAYPRIDEDSRFIDYLGSIESIVTSNAQNDTGLFETNLHDERYLPFEGSGVISQWRLELPANPDLGEPQQFDYDTISDVVLHIRYTSRDGGDQLRESAMAHLMSSIANGAASGMARLFSVRHEFPNEWAKFKSVKINDSNKTAELAFELREEHYPFWAQGHLNKVERMDVIAKTNRDSIEITRKADQKMDTINDKSVKGLLVGELKELAPESPVSPEGEPFKLYFNDNTMEDLWIMVTWKEL